VEKYNGIVGTHTESSSSRKMEKYNGIVSAHTRRRAIIVDLILGRGLDRLLVRDVDAVEELADVLVLNEDALLDLGGGLRDELEVVSLHGDLVLLPRLDALDAGRHRDSANVLLPEEITHLHRRSIVLDGDVDGEMGVDGLHLVAISVRHALDHVFDVADDGPHGGDVFAVAEPLLRLEPLFSDHLDVQLGVLEGLSENSPLALDGDGSVVHRRRNIFGNLQLQARVNGLHFYFFFSFFNLN